MYLGLSQCPGHPGGLFGWRGLLVVILCVSEQLDVWFAIVVFFPCEDRFRGSL